MKDVSKERAKKAVAAIASIRTNLPETFTLEGFAGILGNTNCPYKSQLVFGLKALGILVSVEKGLYKFKSKDPIYYGQVQQKLDEIAKTHENYVQKSRLKKLSIQTTLKESNVEEKQRALSNHLNEMQSFEEECISFLKKLGYKIFKEL